MIIAKKNAAYYLSFPAIDSATPASYKTGVSPVDTAYYKDGAGAWTSLAITDAASEIGSTGVYEIDLTAAEMNHDKVIIKFSVSGMADDAYEFDLSVKLTDDLQDLTAAQVNTEVDTAILDSGIKAETVLILEDTNELQTNQGNWLTATGFSTHSVADIFNEVLSKASYNVGQSAAKLLRQGADLVQLDGAVSDVSPTTAGFNTNLTLADGAIEDGVMIFTNGAANVGHGIPISTYLNANGAVTFSSPDTWPITPVNGDDFVIFANHVHPITQIQAGLATEDKQDIIDTNVDAILVDTSTSLPALIDDTSIKKNNPGLLHIEMVLASDHVTPATGLTVTAQRLIDSGTYASVSGTMTEISNGTYRFDYLAADANGNVITWRFSSATADDTKLTFKTTA